MEAKVLVSLLILSLLSAALAKGGHRDHDHDHDWRNKKHDDDKKCPQLYPSHDVLNMKCSFSGDGCSKITCSMEVEGKSATISLEFSSGEGPASAKIILKVPSLDYEWSHTFKSGVKIQVPGFPLKIKELIGDADVYLMLNIYKGRWGTVFKLTLILETKVQPLEIVLLKDKLPRMGHDGDYEPHEDERWSKHHRFSSWFKRQSTAVKVCIILSAVLVFLMVVSAIAYCCKKRRSRAENVAVKPPTYEEATYPTKAKVAMEPLVNEE